jgi:hypothetical protein
MDQYLISHKKSIRPCAYFIWLLVYAFSLNFPPANKTHLVNAVQYLKLHYYTEFQDPSLSALMSLPPKNVLPLPGGNASSCMILIPKIHEWLSIGPSGTGRGRGREEET